MKTTLINGQFTAQEVVSLLTQLIEVKIKFHENNISSSGHEEDLKMREKKIKNLQNELQKIRDYAKDETHKIDIMCEVNFSK